MSTSSTPRGAMNRPDWHGRLLGMITLTLTGLGFVGLAGVPEKVFRAHPASSLLWLVTLCSVAITGEAVQHRQPWVLRAATTMCVSAVLMVCANFAEWAVRGEIDALLPMVSHVGRWILVFAIALVGAAMEQQKQTARVPVPRPAPRP